MDGRSRVVIGVITLFLIVAPVVGAQTQDAAVQRMVDLNKKALAAYEKKDFEGATQSLMDAVIAGKEAGLASHKMMARTYVHLGAIFIEGLKDKAKGMRYFGMALQIRPDIPMTPSLSSPSIIDAFEEARVEALNPPKASGQMVVKTEPPIALPEPKTQAVGSEPAKHEELAAGKSKRPSRRGSDEPDLPARIPQPLYCPSPDEAPPNKQVMFRCVARPGLHVTRVLLFYRQSGGQTFTAVPSTKSPKGWYNAVIPAGEVTGKSLQYYFEARDLSDGVTGSAGRSDSPNLLLIREGAPSVARGSVASLRHRSVDATAEDNPLAHIKEEKEREALMAESHKREAGSWFIGLGVGSGFGYHREKKLEFRSDLNAQAGMRPSGLGHILPEIGYQWSDRVALSILVRYQYIPVEGSGETRVGRPASGAFAALAKVCYYMGDQNFLPYLSAMAGGGDGFRLVASPRPNAEDPSSSLLLTDTVRGGPVVVGAGAGLLYHLGRAVAILAEIRPLVGVPDFAIVADASMGMQVAF